MPHLLRIALFFAITLFLCSWHLDDSQNDNTVSRAAMVAAMAEHGTMRIDTWKDLTGDKALIDGHYYCDKAPLPQLVMVPVWWLARQTGWKGPAHTDMRPFDVLRVCSFLCASIPFALIVTALWLRVRRDRAFASAAMITALPLFGSFLFVFSGSFLGHLIGAALLLGGWMAIERAKPLLAGALCGAAVLCEYPLALFAACWFARWLLRRDWSSASRMAVSGAPFVLLLLAYNHALTGSMFSIGYDHEANFEFMDEDYGFHLPDPAAFWGLSFSDYRGLFFHMPVLVLALFALWRSGGVVHWWRDPILLPCLLSIILIASFRMWWGGSSYGPRHLTATAVLLAWRCWPALSQARWARMPFIVLSAFGLVCALATKNTVFFGMPEDMPHPLLEKVWPPLRDGLFTDMQFAARQGTTPAVSSSIFLLAFAMGMWALVRIDRMSASEQIGRHLHVPPRTDPA